MSAVLWGVDDDDNRTVVDIYDIPSGGLFSGAEVAKTQAQVDKWGGDVFAKIGTARFRKPGRNDRSPHGRNRSVLAIADVRLSFVRSAPLGNPAHRWSNHPNQIISKNILEPPEFFVHHA